MFLGIYVEKVKKVLGIGVFVALFASMFFSFMVSLSQNIQVIDVAVQFCPQTQQDLFLFDTDEDEPSVDYKILVEKNVLITLHVPERYEVIREDILEPAKLHSKNLSNDIFYPPKTLSV